MKKKNIILSLSVISIITFTGCGTRNLSIGKNLNNKADKETFIGNYYNGKYEEAKKIVIEDQDELLPTLQLASTNTITQNYKERNLNFDKAETFFKDKDKENIATTGIKNFGAVLVNDTVKDYEGRYYEKIMVNTYKGLNFMFMGNDQFARVEFNRALERQRMAKEYFQEEIKEEQAKIDQEQKEWEEKNKKRKKKTKQNFNPQDAAKNKITMSVIDKKYSNLNNFKAYPDFVNPISTYLSSVYFFKEGDYKKARDLMKEVYGMDKENKFVKSEFEYFDKYSSLPNVSKEDKTALVLIEDGYGISKKEMRFDIPLFLVSKKALYTGIALPQLVDGKSFQSGYSIFRKNSINEKIVEEKKVEVVADMDRVIKTEFKNRFPMIITRSVISTALKTYTQYYLGQQQGLLGSIVGTVYQALTTKADTRIWDTLPKDFLASRINLNDKEKILVNYKGVTLADVPIKKDKNMIVYIKKQNEKVTNKYDVIYY